MPKRPYGLQSLKYSLSGPSQRKFADTCLDAPWLVRGRAKNQLSQEDQILGLELALSGGGAHSPRLAKLKEHKPATTGGHLGHLRERLPEKGANPGEGTTKRRRLALGSGASWAVAYVSRFLFLKPV